MQTTKIIKVSSAAWTACVRFWILRAAIIIIGGLILGHFLSHAIASTDNNNKSVQSYND